MSELPLKQQLLEMSIDGIEDVLDIIRQRPDIKEVLLVTQDAYDDASLHFKQFVEGLPDETA